MAELFHSESALVFNSGYHANTGILPAVTTSRSMILADKLVHASIIDGIRLSQAKCIRFKHNDYRQLERLIQQAGEHHDRIIIVTESIFSMDGDESDLRTLVRFKQKYPAIMLYIDEAHAIGVRGNNGLGCCEEHNIIEHIDFLIGTFGKALGSCGAFLICNRTMREYLINTMRTFIFTTALPPINLKWTLFTLNKARKYKVAAILYLISQVLQSRHIMRQKNSKNKDFMSFRYVLRQSLMEQQEYGSL